ncbi:chemotaxis protein histidine kinase CheA [Bradyrhizobium japonicum]
MELRKIIRTDIAASAVAHLTLVALIILISEVHPFHAAAPETVSVDIVTPEQVKQEEAKAEEKAQEQAKENPPEPLPDLKLPKLDFTDKDKAEDAPKPATKQQAAAPLPSPQASPEPQQKQPPPSQAPKQREANVQPQPQQPQPSQQPPPQPQQQPPPQAMPQPPSQQPPPQAMQQPQAAPSAYQTPEPDVTVKYGVMLGLPPELPLELPKDAAKDDGGDAKDSIAAKLPPEVIAALRRHLKSCAKLPAGVDPTDNVNIKLRTVFATDGTLARPPILIEAPPSAKGVAIVKSATAALQACQPYKMLPADKYGEWKILDLPFSPRDFGGG